MASRFQFSQILSSDVLENTQVAKVAFD
ncbi:hypothetical protein OOU_Y34scaffold00697g42 [Pyricularia oryzae Y34]|uniref:Uncharacterized protein n=2 Tax=Pyricularia oryzae TaxID=318829 RepID=A0AA97NSX5_PYRO3|nr:hypothetical protein OOU_Y34scaffold00697g42 [Pyricularia oryzae Y34]